MDKKALYNLLGRYLDGYCTVEEAKLIDDWLELLQENKSFAAYTKADLDSISNRIWEKIQEKTIDSEEIEKPVIREQLPKRSRIATIGRWAAAACIAGALVFAGYHILQDSITAPQADFASIIPATGMVKKTNNTTASQKLLLEDSSVVVLEPGTTLNYPVRFDAEKREVYLEGKAFFDVFKNAKRPFYIYHNNLVTHVLGTSFIINTHTEGKEAEVSVITGRVEVSENTKLVKNTANKPLNGVILTPNQKVIYTERSRQFTASLVDRPISVKTSAPVSFEFSDAAIVTVLASLHKEYGIEIVSENEYINRCTFTGNIATGDLYEKLDIICKAINASYEIKGTKVLIKGAGCE